MYIIEVSADNRSSTPLLHLYISEFVELLKAVLRHTVGDRSLLLYKTPLRGQELLMELEAYFPAGGLQEFGNRHIEFPLDSYPWT